LAIEALSPASLSVLNTVSSAFGQTLGHALVAHRVFEGNAHHCVCIAHDLPCCEPGRASGDAVSNDELKLRHVPPYAHRRLKHSIEELVITGHVEPFFGIASDGAARNSRRAAAAWS
jgi:hypothetical protein